MPNGMMKEQLKAIQNVWGKVLNQPDKVPPGVYEAMIESAEVTQAQSGRLQIKRKFIVRDGQYAGMPIWDYMGLDTEQSAGFVKRWIEQMGFVSPQSAEDLEETVDTISSEHAIVQVQVTQSGDFTNVRVQKVIQKPFEQSAPQAPQAPVKTPFPVPVKPVPPIQPQKVEAPQSPPPSAPPVQEAPSQQVKKVPKKVGAPSPAPSKPGYAALLAFAQNAGLEGINDGMTYEELVAVINGYEFKTSECIAEEVSMLRSIGATVKEE